MFHIKLSLLYTFCLIGLQTPTQAQTVKIKQDINAKTVVFGNEKMSLTLDYQQKANITSMSINGQQVIYGNAGIYSTLRTQTTNYTSLQLSTDPVIRMTDNTLRVSGLSRH